MGSKSTGRFQSHIESLRGMARGPIQERQFPQVERILEDFQAQKDVDRPAWTDAASKLVLRLESMARETEHAGLKCICVKGMLKLDVFGWMVAARLLASEDLDIKDIRSCLDEVEPHVLLGLLDRLLHNAPALPPDLRQFAVERLAGLADMDVEETAKYLDMLGNAVAGPCYAVTAHILQGGFGARLRQALKDREAGEELTALLGRARRLGPSDLAQDLARRLDDPDPTVLAAVLEALPCQCDSSPALAKDVCSLLTHKDRSIRVASLDSVGRLRSANLAQVYSRVFQKAPPLRKPLLPRLAYLGWEEFHAFLAGVDKSFRRYVFWSLFVFLAKLDPRTMAESLLQCAKAAGGPPPQQLWAHLGATPAKQIKEPEPPREPVRTKAEEPEDKSWLGGMFGKGSKKKMEEGGLLKPPGQDSGKGTVRRGETLADRELNGVSYRGSFVLDSSYTDCRIKGGFMNGAVFKDCRFEDTVFEGCDFTGAQWFRCTFRNVVFVRCHLDETLLHRCDATLLLVQACSMRRSHLASSTLRTSRFDLADLSRALVEETALSGVEFLDCLFQETSFSKATETCCSLSASILSDCWSKDFAARHPVFSELEARNMCARLPGLADKMEKAGLAPPPGKQWEQMAALAVDRWFSLKSLRRTRALYTLHNTRREAWGMEKLGRPRSDFYWMLPLVLATDDFDKANELDPATPRMRIQDYTPTYTALTSMREFFPEAQLPAEDKDAVPLEGLYTIGSLGTVAQSRGSDLDYWVCCPLRSMDPDKAALLARKLELLTDWAEQKFDLEAYFFLMETADVTQNNFGFSDKESSGSAQALLLKEEFYRTMVLVAGRPPVWWFVPPGAGQAVYDRAKARLAEQLGAESALDLGHMARVPAEEFFGASLWQIVKGLKSPFKSIMKFALLEAYTAGEGGAVLLCDRLKSNLLAGARSLWEIDPYVALFREVAEYYHGVGNMDNVELVSLAFSLKAERHEAEASKDLPLRMEIRDLLDIFDGKKFAGMARTSEAASKQMDFRELLKMGARINRFMVNTYVNLRDRQADTKTMITPEDMTKLGRKIATYFSTKDNKVERIPILKIKSDFFSELHFMLSYPNNARTWVLQGGHLDPATGRIKMTNLKQGEDLCVVLAWLTANHLYSPKVTVKVDRQAQPLTEEDIRNLVEHLHRFFTDKKTFETDISESLNPERVTRAFFVLNLELPRDTKKIKHVTALYSTNWGEMFVREVPADGSYLAGNPQGFLKKHLDLDVDESLAKDRFLPARAGCTRIFYDEPEE